MSYAKQHTADDEFSGAEPLWRKSLDRLSTWICSHEVCKSSFQGDGHHKRYEEAFAKESLKFEVGVLLILAVGIAIYSVLFDRIWWMGPGSSAWVPMFLGIITRGMAITFRKAIRLPPKWILRCGLVCFVVDAALLTLYHPDISEGHVWGCDPPEMPQRPVALTDEHLRDDSMIAKYYMEEDRYYVAKHMHTYQTQLAEWETQNANFLERYAYDATMVTYALQILLWYNVTWVLLFRHALCALPTSFLIYSFGRVGVYGGEIDVDNAAMLDVLMLAFSMTVALIAKFRLERFSRDLFMVLEEKSREAIHEKVLRFQAEFDKEGWPRAPKEDVRTKPISESYLTCSSYEGAGDQIRIPLSAKSAPAAMQKKHPVWGSIRRKGECLSPSSTVWIDGEAKPVPVSQVAPGQRVLCYDNLAQRPRYVDVVSANILLGAVPWVKITLADGSSLDVTADHPTQPKRKQGSITSTELVPAGELQPNDDSLMVLKMVPVPVESVVRVEDEKEDDEDAQRVALVVQQPDRHEVFVAPTGSKDGGRVAVGSADLRRLDEEASEMSSKANVALMVKNTFIDVQNQSKGSKARASSAPPSLGKPAESDAPPPAPPASSSRRRSSLRGKRSSSEPDLSSVATSEACPESEDGVDIIVGIAADTGVSLSQLTEAQQSGLRSIGSQAHCTGDCKICVFENKHQHHGSARCFKGVLCERCHEDHDLLSRRRHASGAQRRQRKLLQQEAHKEQMATI